MAIYAIGDLQGCHAPLLRLLRVLRFDRRHDRLLFAGDLVNRGPASLECLRFVRSLGKAAVTVLGNHDLHLLARAHGGRAGSRDTLDDVLNAPDREELLDWLRAQPLAYHEPRTDFLMVHAGIAPQWSTAQTLALAQEASRHINRAGADFFRHMYGDQPDRWDERLSDHERTRFVINCLTRMRYCTPEGRIDMKAKGAPGSQPAGLLPWFQVPGRRTAWRRVVCGHWSQLGRVRWERYRTWSLDTGAVWGGRLTAMNLETGELTSTPCKEYRKPGGEAE